MTRYKGRQSTKNIERKYRHHVDVLVPPGGLGVRLNEMYEWHVLYGIKPRHGKGSHDANGAVIRWCFASRKIADSFAAQCCSVRE